LDEPSVGIGVIKEIGNMGVKVGTGQGNILLQVASLDDEKEVLAINLFSTKDVGKILK
jgi:tRNA G46 methylase TrmB